MKPFLPDVNLLIALAWSCHPMHLSAVRWLANHSNRHAFLCEINIAGLVRISGNAAVFEKPRPASDSLAWIAEFMSSRKSSIIGLKEQSFETLKALSPRIQGHKQVADTILVSLAIANGARLATFDQKLRYLSPDPEAVEIVSFVSTQND